jgi:type IV pilus assembly protein PilN
MIKVNLIPVKRKKKAKPIPKFLIIGVLVTGLALLIAGFFYIKASATLSAREQEQLRNKNTLNELAEKIKAVENFEQLNKTFEQRNNIIEQLSKNKSVPVILLNEVSNLIPVGVWLDRMAVTGNTIKLDGYGFTNSDIVSFVDRVKASKLFTDVYLNQSKGVEFDMVPLYQFTLTFSIKV